MINEGIKLCLSVVRLDSNCRASGVFSHAENFPLRSMKVLILLTKQPVNVMSLCREN